MKRICICCHKPMGNSGEKQIHKHCQQKYRSFTEKDEMIKNFNDIATGMLYSLKNDTLTKNEMYEGFGYIRGIRDCANECGILSKTIIEEALQETSRILKNI